VLKTCTGCGTQYAWTLSQCPHDGETGYLESGTVPSIIDAVSSASSGTITVGHTVQVDATSADSTRTLPSAATAGAGGAVIVRKVDSTSHTVTISRAGADLIDGATTYVLDVPGAGVEARSDGVSAWTVTQYTTPNPLLSTIYATRAELGSSGAAMAVVLDT
jgi:hypothetical protein